MRDVFAQLDAVLVGPQPSVYGRAAAFLAENRTKLEDATFISEHREVLERIAGYEKILRVFRDLDA